LEECIASLYDVIDRPKEFSSLTASFDSLKALKQITRGLTHLHTLKIIHRDLKPQNILIASAAPLRLVISDFGLCKKLDLDESSFLQSVRGGGMNAPGSFGYRAPEVLRGEVDTNDLVNTDGEGSGSGEQTREASTTHSNSGSTASTSTIAAMSATAEQKGRKLTRSIDIFSLGCIFFFVLTNGDHPFGSRYEREMNILNDKMFLDGLSVMTESRYEAEQLIRSMCHADPRLR
jgi:serine/threonine-protein kinase/endoribonuclease IRE1